MCHAAAHVIQVKDVGALVLLAVAGVRLSSGVVPETRHGFGIIAGRVECTLRFFPALRSVSAAAS